MPKPGDVFAIKQADGRYGAVRVIRTRDSTSLLCTSVYLERDRPALDDPRLLEIVEQRRFSWRGDLAMRWLGGKPPRVFELLGNIPPTPAEEKTECNVFGRKWDETAGDEAYLEWRWEHDRAAFEEEIRGSEEEQNHAESQARRMQKPKRMMGEATFWSLIDLLDWQHEGNDEKVVAPLVKSLASKSTQDICRFQERMALLLYRLDTKTHASHIGANSFDHEKEYISADAFLYARCASVAKGRAFYESALGAPALMAKDCEFEALLGIAPTAYERKTGRDFEYETGCSFESFSNSEGWTLKD